ncbi:MAG: Uncharacterized protein XD72_2221 [Methanothrix harundinacea]|jgi:hypothetical protein|uniref:DUF6788 domain-containing protein n=1 Tax=Methanothrix harundinacea TaxID=301375 RepID=A0A101FS39_9EURY|nr:MAG: Uncharacterized protein XD72_2221 [Methanothrix harundinacea]
MARQKIVYETTRGEEIKTLRDEARKLREDATKLRSIKGMEPGAREREVEAARLEGEAEDLWNAARLEALTVYKGDVAKKTKTGEATYTYWYASWRESGKVKNVHLGSTKKMDREAATAKARKLKAEALGLR